VFFVIVLLSRPSLDPVTVFFFSTFLFDYLAVDELAASAFLLLESDLSLVGVVKP